MKVPGIEPREFTAVSRNIAEHVGGGRPVERDGNLVGTHQVGQALVRSVSLGIASTLRMTPPFRPFSLNEAAHHIRGGGVLGEDQDRRLPVSKEGLVGIETRAVRREELKGVCPPVVVKGAKVQGNLKSCAHRS